MNELMFLPSIEEKRKPFNIIGVERLFLCNVLV